MYGKRVFFIIKKKSIGIFFLLFFGGGPCLLRQAEDARAYTAESASAK